MRLSTVISSEGPAQGKYIKKIHWLMMMRTEDECMIMPRDVGMLRQAILVAFVCLLDELA